MIEDAIKSNTTQIIYLEKYNEEKDYIDVIKSNIKSIKELK